MNEHANHEQLLLELQETQEQLAQTIRECQMLKAETERLIKEFREFIDGAYKTLAKSHPSSNC